MMQQIDYNKFKEEGIEKLIPRTKFQMDEIKRDVQNIIEAVKGKGDEALIDYTKKFDKVDLKEIGIKVNSAKIDEAYEFVDDNLINAIEKASRNIRKFHIAQLREPWSIDTILGVKAGQVLRPLESVGIYVPGGRAAYPSTVLMTAIPALAAGVDNISICSPPHELNLDGKIYKGINPSILVAANECGIENIYNIGSAWAIAALTYGTQTVDSVLKIVGPGNKYVNTAKMLVKEIVSIDSPAGPSEVGIIADKSANPKYIAYDLISQVEHDPDNVGILITDSIEIIEKTLKNLENTIKLAPRKDIIQESLKNYGLIIKTDNIEQSVEVANEVAIEHLQIMTVEPKMVLAKIQNAGAIFLGDYSPVPLGDYCAGTNHVLPTGGSAKRFSGLNTLDFMKIISTLEVTEQGIRKLEKILSPIAEYEGLFGHRDAIRIRLTDENDGNQTY